MVREDFSERWHLSRGSERQNAWGKGVLEEGAAGAKPRGGNEPEQPQRSKVPTWLQQCEGGDKWQGTRRRGGVARGR